MQRDVTDWSKRPPRRGVSLSAAAQREDGNVFRVLIREMSYGGCQLICGEDLAIGETIVLSVSGMGEIRAQVRWIADEKTGLAFVLEERVLDQRRARIGV